MSAIEQPPRIAPGGRREIGLVQFALLKLGTKRVGGPIPNVMLTLARHRGAFFPWLLYSSRLMPYGKLPGSHAELVILRVAARCGSEYERVHHSGLARATGIGDDLISWTAEPLGSTVAPPADPKIDATRAALLVRAVDELIDDKDLCDATWDELAAVYREHQLIELCLLTGQYAGLAATLNALRTPLEAGAGMSKLRKR